MADNSELLVRVAYLYYKNDLTQQQIADQIGLSRPKVVRLLQQARQKGIVRIEISQKLPIEEEVAFDLQRLFKLKRVIVVRTEESKTETLELIRRALASLIIDELQHHKKIGFSYSRTIGNIAEYLHVGTETYDVAVCDLMGAMIGFPAPYGPASDVARRIGGTFFPMSVPIMSINGSDTEVYLADPNMRRSFETASTIDLAIVGIGNSTTQNILYQSGYITEEIVNNMRRQGIVGELCIRFFDANGNRVESEFESRIISVPWETLSRAKNVTAVVTGIDKVQSTLAAVRSGILTGLVTDLSTARQILDLHSQDE